MKILIEKADKINDCDEIHTIITIKSENEAEKHQVEWLFKQFDTAKIKHSCGIDVDGGNYSIYFTVQTRK